MMTILRAVAVATIAALACGGPASAQLLFPFTQTATPAEPEAAEAAAPAAVAPGAEARALIELLRDDAAREALLAELERLAAQPLPAPAAEAAEGAADLAVAPEATEAAEGVPVEPAVGAIDPPSVGRRIAMLTTETASELVQTAGEFFAGLEATQRRLTNLGGDSAEVLAEIAWSLVPVILVTAAAFLLLRWGARALYRRWGAAARGMSATSRAFVYIGSVLLDAAVVVLAWALGYGITLLAINETATMGVNQSLYLNAFLVVELGKTVLRAILSPATADLRPVPLDDAAARYWTRRGAVMLSLLGYGLLLVVPIVNQTVSFFTGRAVEVVIFSLVVLWSMALVIKHRRKPAAYAAARAEASGGDATLRLVAFVMRFWHWPALVWLVSIFVTAVAQSGSVIPILIVTGRVILAIALGVVAGALIARAAKKGIRLPGEVSSQIPMLEQRLNGFILRFLGTLRFLVLALTIGFIVDQSGLLDVGETFAATFGQDAGGVILSVFIIVTVAFVIWLAIASWVDYKLNPDRAVAATQREQTLLTLLRNAVTVSLVIITLMIALSEIGLDIGPLLASAGVLGLAIGFGAQKLVQDIITGVFIQLENAFNVGDVVTVGGISGVVEKLTIRSVSLRDLNGIFHIIPFSSVDVASNFMRGFSYYVADFGVAYREDIDEVKRIMHEAFSDLIAKDREIRSWCIGGLDYWGVEKLGDSAVVHRARIRTLPGKQWSVGRAYNAYLKKHCDAAGVEIPFPHMTLWFGQEKDGGAPPLRHAPARPQPGDALGGDPMGGAGGAPLEAAAAPR